MKTCSLSIFCLASSSSFCRRSRSDWRVWTWERMDESSGGALGSDDEDEFAEEVC